MLAQRQKSKRIVSQSTLDFWSLGSSQFINTVFHPLFPIHSNHCILHHTSTPKSPTTTAFTIRALLSQIQLSTCYISKSLYRHFDLSRSPVTNNPIWCRLRTKELMRFYFYQPGAPTFLSCAYILHRSIREQKYTISNAHNVSETINAFTTSIDNQQQKQVAQFCFCAQNMRMVTKAHANSRNREDSFS
jgi:hypothetical protein